MKDERLGHIAPHRAALANAVHQQHRRIIGITDQVRLQQGAAETLELDRFRQSPP